MTTPFSPSILRGSELDTLKEERRLAHELGEALRSFESSAEDAELLRQVTLALEEPFLLVVAGEFNAGKSAFINALIGEPVLTEGVTPTTAHITLLRHGETPGSRLRPDGIEEIWHPAAFLRDVAIVDTPGTNAVLRHHEELTSEFIPRSDFILFVTSADRPFTESERSFLERIRAWGKKVVLVLNKIDLLRTPDDLVEILGFVRQHAITLIGSAPELFPISARLAQEARRATSGDEGVQQWESSRMGVLRDYLTSTLDDGGRTRLKLMTPLGVMERLILKYLDETSKRQELLDEDARTVANIEAQLAAHREDMQRDFEQRQRAVQTIILEMRDRGDRFFDDTVRLTRIPDLVRASRVREDFERQVIAGAPQQIDAAVADLIDWMVEREHRLGQDVNEYLARRRQTAASALGTPGAGGDEHVVGGIGTSFDYNRRSVLQRVSTAASRALSSYDQELESKQMATSLQGAVATTAVAEAGAVGLGIGVAIIVGTAAADFTGILAGLVLATLGLGILPLRKRRAKDRFDARTRELSETLSNTLRDQFNREIEAATQRLREALAPYTRFVRVETERVAEVRTTLELLCEETAVMRRRVEKA
ncbi:MAG TPA: dynamin family protein [Ktedonobacterales bacterium]|jgi:small GTP-binding protein|nr:dynamin family protein [Ktedonobacterales bacterium]